MVISQPQLPPDGSQTLYLQPNAGTRNAPQKVSAIVVNFNNSGYVTNCVSSVLRSDYAQVEVIVVDNGSTEQSLETLKRYFDRDGRIPLMETYSNEDFAKATNTGTRRASGSIFVFLNDDTLVQEQWLDEPVRILSRNDRGVSVRIRVASMDDPSRLEPLSTYIDALGTSGVSLTDLRLWFGLLCNDRS